MTMTNQMKQARDEKARTYAYNNAIYIDKAMLNKEGYQYLEEKPAKDFKEGTDWYRNNVWHKASHDDIPKIDNAICLIYKKDFYPEVDHVNWSATKRCFKYGRYGDVNIDFVDKWAYLEDLLPDENI